MAALERGLTMSDVRRMTLGAVVDFVIAYNERNKETGLKSETDSRLEPTLSERRPKYRLATAQETAAWVASMS